MKIKGPLPDASADRFMAAFNDSHISGLVNHCVEVIVWRRTAVGFAVGVLVGALIMALMHR
jgi:hypothetical protein